jgi:hypothetical protein
VHLRSRTKKADVNLKKNRLNTLRPRKKSVVSKAMRPPRLFKGCYRLHLWLHAVVAIRLLLFVFIRNFNLPATVWCTADPFFNL